MWVEFLYTILVFTIVSLSKETHSQSHDPNHWRVFRMGKALGQILEHVKEFVLLSLPYFYNGKLFVRTNTIQTKFKLFF